MKSLAAEKIKVARILLNLGHSYLHSCSLENSEDEEEEDEEEEEEEEEGSDEEEKEEKNQQLDVSKQKEIKKIQIESSKNIHHNIKEEMGIQFDGQIKQELDKKYDKYLQQELDARIKIEIDSEKQNNSEENIEQEFDENKRQEVKEETQWKFNTYIQNESYNNAHIEIDKKEYEVKRKVDDKFDEDVQNKFKTHIQKEVMPNFYKKINYKPNKNMHIAFGENEYEFGKEEKQNFGNNTQQFFSNFYCNELYSNTEKQSYTNNIYIKLNGQNQNLSEDIIQQQFEKNVLQELNGENVLKDEMELDIIPQVNSKIQQKLNENLQEELSEEQLTKENSEINLNVEIQVNSEFPSELDQQVQKEFDREKQQMSEGNIEIELNIELQADSESEQEPESDEKIQEQQIYNVDEEIQQKFDEKLLEEFDRGKKLNIEDNVQNKFIIQNIVGKNQNKLNKNIDFLKIKQEEMIDMQQTFDEQLLEEFDRKKQLYNEGKIQNQSIKQNIQNESIENIEFSKENLEAIEDIQQKCDEKICDPVFQQEIEELVREGIGKIKRQFYGDVQDFNKDISIECNGELLKNFDEEIKVNSEIEHILTENIFEKQNKCENYVERVPEKQKKYRDIHNFEKEINQECSRELLKELDKDIEIKHILNNRFPEQHNTYANNVECGTEKQQQMYEDIQDFDKEFNGKLVKEFYKEIQVDSEFEHNLKEKILEQQNGCENYAEKIFDNGVKHTVHRNIEVIDKNIKMEFDEENLTFFKTKIKQETEEDIQDKINLGLDENLKENLQIEFNENVQVQEIQQEKYDSDVLEMELELDAQEENYEEFIESFQKKIKQEVEKLLCNLHYGEQNFNTNIQYNSNEEVHIKLIKHIQQEIEELKTEIEELNQNQDEELEIEINEKLDITYSISVQVKFLENLLILLYQESIPFYERVEKLCDLYFPTMRKLRKKCIDKTQSEFERGIQQTFNEELLQKLDRILQKEVIKEMQSDTEVHIDMNESTQHKINEEMQEVDIVQRLFYNTETQHKVNEDTKQVVEGEIKEVEREMQVNFDGEVYKEIKENVQEENKEVQQNFDTVIKFNRKIQQNMNTKTQVVDSKVQIDFNDKIMKMSKEEQNTLNKIQTFDKKIWQNKDSGIIRTNKEYIELNTLSEMPDVEHKIQNIFEGNRELHQKGEEEMEVDFDRELQLEVNKQSQLHVNKETQKGINEEIQLQLEFYRKIQQNVEEEFHKKIENEVQKDFRTNLETFTKVLLNKSEEVQQEFDMEMEDNFEDTLQKGSEVEIEEESEVDIEEEFEVDMEKFKDNLQQVFEGVVQNKSNACIEKSKEKIHQFEGIFQQKIDKQSLLEIDEKLLLENYEKPIQELKEEIQVFKDRNEVLEVGEEYDVESTSSIYSFVSTDEELNPIEELSTEEFSSIEESSSSDESSLIEESTSTERESSSTEEEFSSTEDTFSSTEEEFSPMEEEINSISRQKLNKDEQVQYNANIHEFEGDFDTEVQQNVLGEIKYEFEEEERQQFDEIQSEFEGEERQRFDEIQSEFEEEERQQFDEIQSEFEGEERQQFDETRSEFKDLQLEMEMKNIQDLNEIPLELKIQQEQFEEELHQQFKEFQKKFYKNLKLEYDKEQNLKVYKTFNPELSQVFDEQQQKFYDLKDEFHEIKQEYKGFVQQKMFEELQREIDEKQLQEIEEFPEGFDDELNLLNEDIHKEFVELQRECYELEPEFKYNVPLEFDEDDISQLLNQEPFNLFERLHFIHRQKLCNFVDSKQWPENRLYPSSLLDSLFENPFEFKPNVLVITLYSIDIGYSIKITMNKNDSPVETFFNYDEDSILQYVEKEQLPPHLLDILDKAEPGLFYCGCVIAEIHDQKTGVLDKLYRILLHPSNMSIQSDLNQILAENSHINWTYQKRLKLESMLILVSHPVMCMDSSPIAGLTVNLQHQMLSCRSIVLNPLNNKYPKYKSLGIDMFTDSYDDMLFIPKSTNKSQQSSSKDTSSDNIITWKFHFRIKSFKLLKLFVLVITETLECSMLLCMNSKTESFMKMRFKINLKTNQLKTYINMILEILKEKISHDIIVVRKYKSDGKSAPRSIMCVPKLFSENIYEPNYAEIIQLINKLLESKSKIQCDKTKYESEKNIEVQETDGTNISSRTNKKMDHKVKKSIHFINTKKLSRNSNKNLELLNMDLSEDHTQMFDLKNKSILSRTKSSTNAIVVDSSSLKSPTTPLDISLDLDAVSLPKENSTTPETNSYVDPSSSSSIMVVSLDDSPINVVQEELDAISEILSTSVSTTELLSSVSNSINKISSPIIVTSSVSGPITIIPYIPSPTDVVLSVSNPVTVVPSVSNYADMVPSVSTPVTVMSSLSNPITVISSVQSNMTVVSSITSNVSPSEASSTEYNQTSNNLARFKGLNMSIGTKLKPIILSKTKVLKYSERNGDSAINSFDNKIHQTPTLYDVMNTASGTLFTQSLSPEFLEKISVTKHAHKNGICLYGPRNAVNNKAMSQITILKPKTSSIEQTTKNLQLDRRKNIQNLDNVLSTDIGVSSDLEVTLPNVFVPLNQFLNQSNILNQVNTDLMLPISNDSFTKCQTLNNMKSFVVETISSTNNLTNEDSFQDINNTTSSNIDGYKGVKRKRSTS